MSEQNLQNTVDVDPTTGPNPPGQFTKEDKILQKLSQLTARVEKLQKSVNAIAEKLNTIQP